MHYLELGGAESALLGLLQALEGKNVQVDLFLHAHRGELLPHIPAYVNLLPEIPSYSVIEAPLIHAIRRGHPLIALGRIVARIRHRLHRRLHPHHPSLQDASEFQYVANCVQPFLPRINPAVTYDLAISFLQPHNYVLHRVNARRRLAWIHTDYSKIYVNPAIELPNWAPFDHIVSISPDVTRTFLQTFPALAPRIIEIENILPEAYIRTRANSCHITWPHQLPITTLPPRQPIPQYPTLLSIGRFSYPKNFDNIPAIARILVHTHNIPVQWYIIGYGADEPLIRRQIQQQEMQGHVHILGKKENPYPYIAACDIYVQPSRYEGKSITVREAQILRRPVAIAAYPTAPSQVRHLHDGIIFPQDNTAAALALANLIRNPRLQASITQNLSTHDYALLSQSSRILSLIP